MKKIILLLIIIGMLTGCGRDKYEKPDEVSINLKENVYEVYSKVHLYDFIESSNVEVKTENKLIKTDQVGEFFEDITYIFNKKKYNYKIKYNIVDTEAPVLINVASVRTVKVNEDAYFCDEIVFADNYDRTPRCEIEGNYDLTTVGTYNVNFVIKDSSNNETKKGLKINVVDSIASNNNNNTKKVTLPISKVIEEKKNENTMIGIDVSRWQTDIDFEKVKADGVEFVIMRMGINSDIDKDISVDTYYERNIRNARNAGLKVGIYVYSSAIDIKTAREHAEWTLNVLNGTQLDFPIAFDWENWSKFRKYQISTHDINEVFKTFGEVVRSGGYEAMLYSSKFYLEKIWRNSDFPVWLAHYTNQTNYEGDYFLWQMSNVGRVNGINGDVDIDILYKEKTSLFD